MTERDELIGRIIVSAKLVVAFDGTDRLSLEALRTAINDWTVFLEKGDQ